MITNKNSDEKIPFQRDINNRSMNWTSWANYLSIVVMKWTRKVMACFLTLSMLVCVVDEIGSDKTKK